MAESVGYQPGGEATWDAAVEPGELGAAEAERQAAGGVGRDGRSRVRPAELEAENNRLRRELANAKLDLEIVKKAAAYFAKESR